MDCQMDASSPSQPRQLDRPAAGVSTGFLSATLSIFEITSVHLPLSSSAFDQSQSSARHRSPSSTFARATRWTVVTPAQRTGSVGLVKTDQKRNMGLTFTAEHHFHYPFVRRVTLDSAGVRQADCAGLGRYSEMSPWVSGTSTRTLTRRTSSPSTSWTGALSRTALSGPSG